MLFVFIVTLLCLNANRSILHGQVLPFRNYTIADGLISDNINDVCEDSLGFIWIATSDGLSRFDSQEFVNYTTADGLASNNLSCILADRSLPGVVWIGTDRNGVVRFSNGLFRNYRIDPGPDQRGVNELFQDPTGRVWGGTDGGLFYIENDSMTKEFSLAFQCLHLIYIRFPGRQRSGRHFSRGLLIGRYGPTASLFRLYRDSKQEHKFCLCGFSE